MATSSPWEMLGEADSLLLNYLSTTGSVDDRLIRALVLLREITKDFEILVAKNELEEYQPEIH